MKIQTANYKIQTDKGFALIEIIIVVSIIALIGGVIFSSVLSFRENADLSVASQNIVDKLRTARVQTVASKSAGNWGVRIDSSSVILFKGTVYSAGDPNNEIYNLPSTLEIANGSLAVPADIVFERITGKVLNYGIFDLRVKSNPLKSQTIKIESNGQSGLSETPLSPLGEHVMDWRHTHFIYERSIDANNEILNLTIDGSSAVNLPIIDYIDSNNHFNWSGTVSVGGNGQFWEIHTHYLNDISNKTVFSIYRGGGNNKSMVLTISGESGVNLISYDASGAAVKGTSIYALDPQAQ